MKVSDAIKTLAEVQKVFGDIAITGGYMSDEQPLDRIIVVDQDGVEAWPNGDGDAQRINGVFLT